MIVKRIGIAVLITCVAVAILNISGCITDSRTYSISGTITIGGAALSGVTVSLTGDTVSSTTTDANGNYAFSGVSAGSYTITPTKTSYSFAPWNRIVSLNGIDAPGFNFTGVGVAKISANQHTVYLRQDNTVWACGKNDSGQLGDGTTTDRSSYVPVVFAGLPATSKIIDVEAGYDHTVALQDNGTLWVWGNNNVGQLGITPSTPVLSPQHLPSWATLYGTFTAIAAGNQFTLAVRGIDGAVFAWGSNSVGQLGTNSDPTVLSYSATPVQVLSLLAAIKVSAGYDHALVLTSAYTAWTWGGNDRGQCGLNSTTASFWYPYQVPLPSGVISIAAGYKFSAVLLNYRLATLTFTWGANDVGQLGVGTNADIISPVQLSSTFNFISVATGYNHAIGLQQDGTLWAWGANDSGQLGQGTTIASNAPLQVNGVSSITTIAAGYKDSLLLNLTPATAYVWGDNSYGQLGTGDNNEHNSPYQISLPH